LIGLLGAAIPLVGMYFLYNHAVEYMVQQFRFFSEIIVFVPAGQIYPLMIGVALLLGVGIGFFGSFFTIRKYLKV